MSLQITAYLRNLFIFTFCYSRPTRANHKNDENGPDKNNQGIKRKNSPSLGVDKWPQNNQAIINKIKNNKMTYAWVKKKGIIKE